MWTMAIGTMREMLEAFLIVAIAATWLHRSGRRGLIPALAWGVLSAIAMSVAVGGWLVTLVLTPLAEGVLAVLTAVLVGSMAVYTMRTARRAGAQIAQQVADASARPGGWAWVGVFSFALLMVAREGIELALITAALARQQGAAAVLTGAAIGLAGAAAVSFGWLYWGRRVPLGLFLRATGIFLALFTLQLLLYAFHEFTEAGALPLDNAYWHLATEAWVEGDEGTLVSAAVVLIPAAWLVWALRRESVTPNAHRA
jgi:high-affinity iron transporter